MATRGIKSKFHEVLIELCGGEEEYLADITGSFGRARLGALAAR